MSSCENLLTYFPENIDGARYVFDGTPPDLKKEELAKRYLVLS